MKILIDTNIVLDLILEREPFIERAIALFAQIEQGNLEGYVAATTNFVSSIVRPSKLHSALT